MWAERNGETGVDKVRRQLADVAFVGEHEREHGRVFGDVIDLDGLDVAPHLAGDGGDLGNHAGTVLHGDPHLQQALGARQPCGRQRAAGIGCLGEQAGQRCAIARFKRVGELPDDALHLAQTTQKRIFVVEGDAAPQLGRAGRDARGVLEPARCQAHKRILALCVTHRKLHKGAGGEMRHVADHGHRRVMLFARQADDARADAGDQLVQAREVLGRRIGVGAQDPVRALEQVGASAHDTVLLGAGHRVSGNEVLRIRKRVRGHLDDAAFRGCGIGDDAAIIPLGQIFQIVFHHADGRCQNHQVAAVFDKRAELRGIGGGGSGGPASVDGLDAGGQVGVDGHDLRRRVRRAQCGGKAGADEAEADDGYVFEATGFRLIDCLCHKAMQTFRIRSRIGRCGQAGIASASAKPPRRSKKARGKAKRRVRKHQLFTRVTIIAVSRRRTSRRLRASTRAT